MSSENADRPESPELNAILGKCQWIEHGTYLPPGSVCWYFDPDSSAKNKICTCRIEQSGLVILHDRYTNRIADRRVLENHCGFLFSDPISIPNPPGIEAMDK